MGETLSLSPALCSGNGNEPRQTKGGCNDYDNESFLQDVASTDLVEKSKEILVGGIDRNLNFKFILQTDVWRWNTILRGIKVLLDSVFLFEGGGVFVLFCFCL